MQRSTTEWRKRGDGEWEWASNRANITRFFEEGIERSKPYESFITLGMRGEGDEKMKADDPQATLQDVVSTQREIIDKAYGKARPMVKGVSQSLSSCTQWPILTRDAEELMALYKEVLEYYEGGLAIPDNVTRSSQMTTLGMSDACQQGKSEHAAVVQGYGHPHSTHCSVTHLLTDDSFTITSSTLVLRGDIGGSTRIAA
jgi:hypothetical protein